MTMLNVRNAALLAAMPLIGLTGQAQANDLNAAGDQAAKTLQTVAAKPADTAPLTRGDALSGKEVTLKVIGERTVLTGWLVDYQEGVITVSTELGEINVSESAVICEGPGCPAELVTASLEQTNLDDATQAEANESPDSFVMLADVMFDFGQSRLVPEGIEALEAAAVKLPRVQRLEVIGHTDNVGSAAYNEWLGMERAKAVLAWLEQQGHVTEGNVRVLSAGETKPMAANRLDDGSDNPKGRAMNRRVEFRILE